jgi:quinol monooxygenase YgiN
MIVVAGSVPIAPDKLDSVREAIAVVCQATRTEQGCISYDFSFDAGDPSLVRVFERWETAAALDAHLAQPHTQRFLEALGGMASGAPDVQRYVVDRVEPL